MEDSICQWDNLSASRRKILNANREEDSKYQHGRFYIPVGSAAAGRKILNTSRESGGLYRLPEL